MGCFEIIRHERKNDHQLFELQRVVYPNHRLYRNTDLTEKYWQWRYFSNPAIESHVYIAKDKNTQKVVGMRPMSIIPVKVDGRVVRAIWLTAVVTHPDYRNQGIFSALVRHSMMQAKKLDTDFAYTFPNQNSYPIYKRKPEWRTIANIPIYFKILNYPRTTYKMLGHLLSRKDSFGGAKRPNELDNPSVVSDTRSAVKLSLASHLEHDYNDLWESASKRLSIAIPRDADFLKWRYFNNPNGHYEVLEARSIDSRLQGYLITGNQSRFGIQLGLIVDLLVRNDNHEVIDSLLKECLRRLKVQGIEAVCVLQQKRPINRILTVNYGFLPIPNFVEKGRVNLIGSMLTSNNDLELLLSDFDNWFINWGDTDNA